MFPVAISAEPLNAATRQTRSSGSEVPTAITVSPMIRGLIPILAESAELPSIAESAPLHKPAMPATSKAISKNTESKNII